jgi:hypothetical protein
LHGGDELDDDDDDDDVLLVVSRAEKYLMALFCNYDEVIYTNPSLDGELAVLG